MARLKVKDAPDHPCQSTREEIIAANPLPRFLAERGHELRPAGRNFVTNACPVTPHKQRHRPVSIETEKNLWHCNDCDRGGTVIEWVMIEKNVSAVDAIRKLAGMRSGFEPKRLLIKTYDYTDESGKLLFQTCRYQPKHFKQRQPDSKGRWIWDIDGVRRVLYRLPEVVAAQTVAITEGEKDADNLCSLGITATTNPMGAGKWRDEYSETLRGKDVVIFGDVGDDKRDGEIHVERVIRSLAGVAYSIKHVTLPDGFHDVSDFIASLPAESVEQTIKKLIEATPVISPPTKKSRTADAEAIPAHLNSPLPKVQLPGDGRLLSAFAADCAKILKDCGIYQRGGVAFIVNQQRNGLDVITAPMLRTLAEQHLVCFRVKCSGDDFVSLPHTMSTDARKEFCRRSNFYPVCQTLRE